MFGEPSGAGFIPLTQLPLQSGILYNVVIDLLIVLACYAAYYRTKPRSFAIFLFVLGNYWLLTALGNLCGWFNLINKVVLFGPLLKFTMAIPAVVLLYYLLKQTFKQRAVVNIVSALFGSVGAAYVVSAVVLDGNSLSQNYWGVVWRQSFWPLALYVQGLLLPIILLAMFLVLTTTFRALREQKKIDLTLYWGAIVFALLENAQATAAEMSWPNLLLRLLYILIAFGGYLFYTANQQAQPAKPKRRWPVMAKLIGLFALLSLLPIVILSFLTFVSFKEIVDLYIYKPLLLNLKTSREAFLAALTDVQLQALVLTSLTSLLVVLASVVVSRGIAGSLKKLAAAMAKVSQGDFTFKLTPDSNDELGDVVNYFNEMAAEVKRSREIMEKWNRELEIKVAERTQDLRVLYNTSQAIGSSLDLELMIDRAIEQLKPVARIERYALLNPDRSVRFARGSVEPAGALLAPLKAKGEERGFLLVEAPADPAARGRISGLLATIADQLAVALENVGVYEKEKEAVTQLTELDRLKNEFISMVSHELRTPVTSADGYVQLFLAGAAGPISEDQKKYLTIVQDNDQRLLTLINRLLDFSKIESGRFTIKKELLSINEVIDRTVKIMGPQCAKKEASVRLNLKAKNVNFMGDPEKIGEVLINLIENALKFSQEGARPEIVLSTRDNGDFLRVEVADRGIGLAQEQLEKIFNKFYQVEETMTRKVGGVGLGLAIVKEIVGNHNGRIWAESDGQGRGAKLIFELPVAEKR